VSTGQPVLRDWQYSALVALCRRLGWTLEELPAHDQNIQQAS